MTFKKDYLELCHAMQSGVASKMNYDDSEVQPKHLRVGVNSALVSNGALIDLLVDKGVFTEEEYSIKLNEWMQLEVDRYEAELAAHFGTKIALE